MRPTPVLIHDAPDTVLDAIGLSLPLQGQTESRMLPRRLEDAGIGPLLSGDSGVPFPALLQSELLLDSNDGARDSVNHCWVGRGVSLK